MHKGQKKLHESPPRLIGGGVHSAPQGKDFPAHQHTVWEVVYYTDGDIVCPVGDQVYAGRPGTLLCTPPGVPHAERARTAYRNIFLSFDAAPDAPWPTQVYDDERGTLRHLCETMVREYWSGADDREAMLRLLTGQFDLLLRRAAAAPSVPEAERAVRRAERLLETRYNVAPQSGLVGAVAREVGVSPSTLRAYFGTLRPYSPREYLQRVRLENALALLRTSDLTLEAIASLSGYDSASHLSRRVRRAFGRTPGSLRRGDL